MTESSTTESTDKATLQRKAYGAATKALREAHREEFNVLMAKEAKTLGVEWKPKPTDEEKAADQLAALLAAHPNLREQMGIVEAGPAEGFAPEGSPAPAAG